MKKVLFAFLVMLLVQIPCFSLEKLSVNALPNESYLVLLDEPAKTVKVSDTTILDADIIATLYNERNQILLKTLQTGVARLYIATENEMTMIEFNVDVLSKDKIYTPKSSIVKSVLKLDMPNSNEPFPFELDEPPVLRGLSDD
ncbi:hypothetical protein IJE86_10515 [bacterium]|nr:hypothetical protein [bacterium]